MALVYKLYRHKTSPDDQGFYLADFIGQGTGDMDGGTIIVSNSTGGNGNLTGFLSSQITAAFQFIDDRDIFISTDGTRMTFQNIIGKNGLSFIKGFLEYVLQTRIINIEGNTYMGLNMKDAYIVKYTTSEGRQDNATLTTC